MKPPLFQRQSSKPFIYLSLMFFISFVWFYVIHKVSHPTPTSEAHAQVSGQVARTTIFSPGSNRIASKFAAPAAGAMATPHAPYHQPYGGYYGGSTGMYGGYGRMHGANYGVNPASMFGAPRRDLAIPAATDAAVNQQKVHHSSAITSGGAVFAAENALSQSVGQASSTAPAQAPSAVPSVSPAVAAPHTVPRAAGSSENASSSKSKNSVGSVAASSAKNSSPAAAETGMDRGFTYPGASKLIRTHRAVPFIPPVTEQSFVPPPSSTVIVKSDTGGKTVVKPQQTVTGEKSKHQERQRVLVNR